MSEMLRIENLSKSFLLHQQGGSLIEVLKDFSMSLSAGEAVGAVGPSGAGKSSLLKLIFGTYRCGKGNIHVKSEAGWTNVAAAAPLEIIALRRRTVGYVTQFLRVIPRVPALTIVAEPLIERGVAHEEARAQAGEMLSRLNIPERLWNLSPTTFSGGEQQRVNIARGFIASYPILLLDEPTASLDAENRKRVLDLVDRARAAGSAILGVFHDEDERKQVCGRTVVVAQGA